MVFSYFAAAGAAAGVAVEAAVLFADFLFFLTCFFATGAELSAGAPAACFASDSPAVASVRESPITSEVIFFMVSYPVLFSRHFVFLASVSIDGSIINPT
jgi:hypothetical protein